MVCLPTKEDTPSSLTSGPSEPIRKGAKPGEPIASPSRVIVGFVTSGGFSFTRARGTAIALCKATVLAGSSPPERLLVRNPHSSQYYYATVNIL